MESHGHQMGACSACGKWIWLHCFTCSLCEPCMVKEAQLVPHPQARGEDWLSNRLSPSAAWRKRWVVLVVD